jgi:hypothetical protein
MIVNQLSCRPNIRGLVRPPMVWANDRSAFPHSESAATQLGSPGAGEGLRLQYSHIFSLKQPLFVCTSRWMRNGSELRGTLLVAVWSQR